MGPLCLKEEWLGTGSGEGYGGLGPRSLSAVNVLHPVIVGSREETVAGGSQGISGNQKQESTQPRIQIPRPMPLQGSRAQCDSRLCSRPSRANSRPPEFPIYYTLLSFTRRPAGFLHRTSPV